jgi:hypothetical protein
MATLQLPDCQNMKVLHCEFGFTQAVDAIGKPNSIPHGGLINITVATDGKTDLFQWMIHPTMEKTGTITFYFPDGIHILQTIKFIDAICVDYYETFDFTGQHPVQIELTMSPWMLEVNGIPYKNNWPK